MAMKTYLEQLLKEDRDDELSESKAKKESDEELEDEDEDEKEVDESEDEEEEEVEESVGEKFVANMEKKSGKKVDPEKRKALVAKFDANVKESLKEMEDDEDEEEELDEVTMVLPSDGALSALFVASKKNKAVGPKVKAELLKLDLVDKSGKVSDVGKMLLDSPEADEKIKELSEGRDSDGKTRKTVKNANGANIDKVTEKNGDVTFWIEDELEGGDTMGPFKSAKEAEKNINKFWANQ